MTDLVAKIARLNLRRFDVVIRTTSLGLQLILERRISNVFTQYHLISWTDLAESRIPPDELIEVILEQMETNIESLISKELANT